MVNQILGEYQARGFKMMAYLSKVKDSLAQFDRYSIQQVPREKNSNADALAKLASTKETESLSIIPVEHLSDPSIKGEETQVIQAIDTWMTPIIKYLEEGSLPSNKNEARKLRRHAVRFLLLDGILYRRGHSMPLLRCVSKEQSKLLLEEVHEGFYGDHAGGQSLSKKILRQGYFWPTMNEDSKEYVRKCDKCQRFAEIPRAAPNELKQMQSTWPFEVWG